VISALTLGKPLGFMDGNGKDKFSLVKATKTFGRYIVLTSPMPWLHTILRENPIARTANPSPFITLVRKRVNQRLDVENHQVEKAESPAAKADLLSHFIDAHKTNPLMSKQNLEATAATNLVAGSLSPGSTMNRLCRFIATNPEAQDAAYRELEQARITTPPQFDDVQGLPYLDGVVREALRLHGSSSLGLQRLVGKGGLQLPNGLDLPAGTQVMCAADANNSNARLWGADVDLYRPERWMQRADEDEASYKERRAAYERANLTFGSGSRSCVGKNVAMLEIFKVVASLLSSFRVSWSFRSHMHESALTCCQLELIEETKRGEIIVRVHKRKGMK
jgi:cytochrome P450